MQGVDVTPLLPQSCLYIFYGGLAKITIDVQVANIDICTEFARRLEDDAESVKLKINSFELQTCLGCW